MDSRPPLSLEESLAAAQGWWREAGVDLAFNNEPQPWLADEEPLSAEEPSAVSPAEAESPRPRPRVGGDPATWPEDLPSFHRWWMEEPSLDHGGTFPRIAPRGRAGAPLMMLVPMPEAEDRETLLTGLQGKLLASFAMAAGLAPEAVYVAAALPRHTPLPDWERLRGEGHGEVLLHHVALAEPRRLMVFGSGILPLLGHAPPQAAPEVSEISIQTRKLPLLATYAPDRLLAGARQRAALWQRWLEWTDGDTE